MEDLTASQQAMIKKLGEIAPITKWEIADKIVENLIKRLIDNSEVDLQKVFTNFELCREIVGHIPDLSGSIAVVANLEFVYILICVGVEAERISFASPDPDKRRMALYLFGVGNVYKYNNILGDDDDMPKFDVVLANPPYDKKDGEPLYYQFLRAFEALLHEHSAAAVIVPAGWMTGPGAEDIRLYMWSKFDVQSMVYRDRTAFSNSTHSAAQPTVTCLLTKGHTTTFSFTRIFKNIHFNAVLDPSDFTSKGGLPLVFGEVGLMLAKAALRYPTKYQLAKNCNSHCVYVSDANNSSSIVPTKMSLDQYFNKIQTPFYVSSTGSPKPNRNHHCVATESDANNLRLWLDSIPGKIIFTQWATTHRNTGTNLGQVPAIIVDGEYTDERALKMLGLTDDQIELYKDTFE